MLDPFPGTALLAPGQVMKLLGLSKTTFYRLQKDRDFPRPVLIAGMRKYRKDDVLRYLERLPEAPDEAEEKR